MNKKVALVTGGSQGIGLAIAEMFVRHGFSVAICARKEDRLRTASERLVTLADSLGLGGSVLWKSFNMGDPKAVQGFVEGIVREFGRLDVLVNNAAIIEKKPFESFSADELSEIVATNVLGVWVCTRFAIPYLKQSPFHLVINISSEVDNEPLCGFVAYSSAKGAITTFTKAIAVEFDQQEIKAIGIRPHRVRTEAWNRVRAGDESFYVPEDVAQLLEKLIFVSSDTVKSGQIINLKDMLPFLHKQSG